MEKHTMKNKYIFNKSLEINELDDQNVIFTPNMEKVYILGNVESVIIREFFVPISIDSAIQKISTFFDSNFCPEDCREDIDKLITEKILIYVEN